MRPLNLFTVVRRDFKMGASIAESKPRKTGYKQDDQTYLQKQVIISSRPAFVLIGPVCGFGALRVKSECHWLLHNILSFIIVGYTSRASAVEKQRKKNTFLFCRSAFALLHFFLSREGIISCNISFCVWGRVVVL